MNPWERIEWAMRVTAASRPIPRYVLLALVRYADEKAGSCWPSQATLAGLVYGSSEPHQIKQIRLATKVLVDQGLVSVEEVPGRGNRYTLSLTYPGLSETPVSETPRSVTVSDPGLSVTRPRSLTDPPPRSVGDPLTTKGHPDETPTLTPTFSRGLPMPEEESPRLIPPPSGQEGFRGITKQGGRCRYCNDIVDPGYGWLWLVEDEWLVSCQIDCSANVDQPLAEPNLSVVPDLPYEKPDIRAAIEANNVRLRGHRRSVG